MALESWRFMILHTSYIPPLTIFEKDLKQPPTQGKNLWYILNQP